jgi:hypothetical protein
MDMVLNWKLIFAVVAGVILAITGILSGIAENIDLGEMFKRTVDFFGKVLGEETPSIKSEVSFVGNLHTSDTINFATKNGDVTIKSLKGTLLLKEEKVEFKNTLFSLKNFTGSFTYFPNRTLIMKGKVESVELNGVQIYPKGVSESVSIYGECVNDGFNVSNVFIHASHLNASGKLETSKVVIMLDNDELNIKNFQGFLSADKEFRFKGSVESLQVFGREEILVR